jgi:alpha-1,3-glucosyltransferase
MRMVGVSSFPNVPASVCAVLLLLSLLPGLYWGTWKAAVEHDNQRLVLAVIYSAMSSFQLGFHVHEKAILNAIVPMVFLICSTSSHTPETGGGSMDGGGQLHDKMRMGVLRVIFIQMTALGLLGIFPLLFRCIELPLKLVSYVAYMALCYHVLLEQNETVLQSLGIWRILIELLPLAAMCMGIIVVLDFVPMQLYGKLEFLPLLVTSAGCSVGLIVCWFQLFLWIMS